MKKYIDVIAEFSKEGELIPLKVKLGDGNIYEVDRILDRRRAASLKAGGAGIRYTCRICGRQIYLFYEENNQWFLEENYL